jgi:hypothetical protein
MLARLQSSVAGAPAPWFVTGLGVIASLVVGLGHFSAATDAVIFSLATALGTLAVAATVRPVSLSVISGAAAVILGDFSIFGLHLSSDAIGALVGAITFALGMVLHLAGTPAASPAKPR